MTALDKLQEKPRRFTLFAALRALDASDRSAPRTGTAASRTKERVTLEQAPYLEFAPSEVRSVRHEARWTIVQDVFGVFGPQGSLPLHLTELVASRSRHDDDDTLRDFINMFQHRLATQFYRAWADSEPVVQADRPADDRFRPELGSLVGLDLDAEPAAAASLGADFVGQAALLVMASRPAEALESLLRDQFDLEAEVRPYVARWVASPADTHLRLGLAGSEGLGRGAVLGESSWQANHSFDIVVGPVSAERLKDLLPGGRLLAELREWVRFYTTDEWHWQLRIKVRRDVATGANLSGDMRLGWTARCGERLELEDEVVIDGNLDGLACTRT